MIGGMPSDLNDEVLGMEIEDILGISEGEYKVESLDNGYLLVLSKCCTEQGTHIHVCVEESMLLCAFMSIVCKFSFFMFLYK